MGFQPGIVCAGELHRVSPTPMNCGLNLQSSPSLYSRNFQFCCKPSIDARRNPSTVLNRDSAADKVPQSRQRFIGRGAFASHSLVKYRGRYQQLSYYGCTKRYKTFVRPAAVLNDGVVTETEESSSSCDGDDQPRAHNLHSEHNATEPIARELSALDSYFSKLHSKADVEHAPLSPLHKDQSVNSFGLDRTKAPADSGERPLTAAKNSPSTSTGVSVPTEGTITKVSDLEKMIKPKELRSVDAYFEKMAKGGATTDQPSENANLEEFDDELADMMREIGPGLDIPPLYQTMNGDEELDIGPDPDGSESSMVYILVAINIAVYLFGLASPIETSEMGISTLPLFYGSKVNELILDGQWWRLITPMFLHSGFLHLALSSWALLFFGPQVESVYGSLAFCMIYFLGGLCGNIFSFFHTPDATVGGTGPFFAILSSWIVYLLQNRKSLGEDSADYGIRMTVSMSALVIALSYLLPIDEWIHLGALLPGALFGAFACPTVQLTVDAREVSAKSKENADGLYAVYESPAPLSMTLVFSIFIVVCLVIFNMIAPMAVESQLLNGISQF